MDRVGTRRIFAAALVPLDFSPGSERALHVAARLAAQGTALTLLHVVSAIPLGVEAVLRRRERAAAERTRAANDQLGLLNAEQAHPRPTRAAFIGPFEGEAIEDFSVEGRKWGRLLDHWASRITGARATVRTMLRVGDPAVEIVEAAADVDLIVLALLGHSRLHRWLVGSTAERVLRLARCPVLAVPPER
jgi:nucleotide-binding universal stress UspA family protein